MPSSDQHVYARGHHEYEKNMYVTVVGPTCTEDAGQPIYYIYAHMAGDSRTFNLMLSCSGVA